MAEAPEEFTIRDFMNLSKEERDDKRNRTFSRVFDMLDQYTATCEAHCIDPEQTAETYYRLKHLGDAATSLAFRMFSPVLGDETEPQTA